MSENNKLLTSKKELSFYLFTIMCMALNFFLSMGLLIINIFNNYWIINLAIILLFFNGFIIASFLDKFNNEKNQ